MNILTDNSRSLFTNSYNRFDQNLHSRTLEHKILILGINLFSGADILCLVQYVKIKFLNLTKFSLNIYII